MKYRIAGLFSGAGGLDLGFYLTKKFDLVLANEILEAPVKAYSKNFGVPVVRLEEVNADSLPAVVLGDVENLDFSLLDGEEVDVVVGGPPCQDFSILRGSSNRKGIQVKRGRLYAHFVRALVHIQPKIFVFENVPGLLTANKGKAYEVIKEDFTKLALRWREVKELVKNGFVPKKTLGYELIFSEVVDMTALGVPQMRRRLIIIGVRRDLISGFDALYKISSLVQRRLRGAGLLFEKYPLAPLEVFEGDTLDRLQGVYEEVMREYEGVWEEVSTEKARVWKKEVWDKLTFDIVKDYAFFNKIQDFSEDEFKEALKQHEEVLKMLGYWGRPVDEVKFPDGSHERPKEKRSVIERMKRIPPGENHEFVKGTPWEVVGLMSNIYRRSGPLAPAPTVIAYGGGGTWGYHYRRNLGRLTNRERARLQTFPDWFLFVGNTQEVRAQIGEAVPPLGSYRIAQAVEEVLKILK